MTGGTVARDENHESNAGSPSGFLPIARFMETDCLTNHFIKRCG
jgi:hypothetical protein